MTDVFLSYASADLERARTLANALEARGWSVWWDRRIVAGQRFDQIIEHELESAKSVVVLWSEASIASEWVRNEATVASQRGVIVPALIERVKPPLEFRRKQTADLVNWEGDPSDGGFHTLCDGVVAATKLPGSAPRQSTSRLISKPSWNLRWTLSAIAAITLAIGIGAYWVTSLPQKPTPGEKAIWQNPFAQLNGGKSASRLTVQTLEGLTATVARFEKTGELLTLELILHNTATDDVAFCTGFEKDIILKDTKLIDETTGENWGISYAGRDVPCYDDTKLRLANGESYLVWMKFKVENPERRRFTLAWTRLNRPLENLSL